MGDQEDLPALSLRKPLAGSEFPCFSPSNDSP
jgi:hypothetical protein